MSFLSKLLLKTAGRAAAGRFEKASSDPAATQQHLLEEILHRSRDTEYGRDRGFAKLRTLSDWRQEVPVVDYEKIRPLVRRMERGEPNVLTAEPPVLFARTSGTTGEPKNIPVTKSCLGGVHSDQMKTWLYHALRAHPKLFDGKALSLVSPAVEGHTDGGLPYGSTSGHIYRHLPAPIRGTYAIPYDVFTLHDYASKYYLIALIGLLSDVTFFCTANPSSILKHCETVAEHADDLIRDVAGGTVNRNRLVIEGGDERVIANLEKRLRPNPERARFLERARELGGQRLLPKDYWPRLQLIGCWKGGTVGSYLARFSEWFSAPDGSGIPVRDWGYLSSECRGSIPLEDEGSGGVLAVAANVYDFVEADDLERNPEDAGSWRFLDVLDLRRGGEYYIFVTTTGGLYRYDMNDIIRVVGFHHQTPVIEFVRKGRGMTSLTGEKISVNQVIAAFEGAGRELGLALDHYKAEADEAGSRYVFKVECREPVPGDSRRRLLEALDRLLGETNLEYRAKRDSLRLNPPLLLLMKTGWYSGLRFRDERDFQRKTIKLSPRTEDGEESVEAVVELSRAGGG